MDCTNCCDMQFTEALQEKLLSKIETSLLEIKYICGIITPDRKYTKISVDYSWAPAVHIEQLSYIQVFSVYIF